MTAGNTLSHGSWFYPSNQLNLMMTLAAGLFLPPAGFGDKYYRDLLQRYPGWIPLFRTNIPVEVVAEVIADASHLTPVAVELDISVVKGNIKAVSVNGEVRDALLPDGLQHGDSLLLIPAPLSTRLIAALFFDTKAAKESFAQRARSQYKNVALAKLPLRVKKGLFIGRSHPSLPTVTAGPALPLSHANAIAAVRAMLLHFADRGEPSCSYYEWVFRGDEPQDGDFDAILRQTPAWCRGAPIDPSADDQVRLFWALVEQLSVPVSTGMSDYDRIIETLRDAAATLADAKRKAALEILVGDLRGLRGLSNQSIDELLQKHRKPFSRSLILFFIHDSCRALLEFNAPKLTPTDYLVAAILFGAREGWTALPLDLRHGPAFASEVSEQQVTLLQRCGGTAIEFGASPPWVAPLYRLLAVVDDNKEEKRRTRERLNIARALKWDCINTTITLGKGDYPMQVSPSGIRIQFSGEPKSVQTNVSPEQFFSLLATTGLPQKWRIEVRKRLS